MSDERFEDSLASCLDGQWRWIRETAEYRKVTEEGLFICARPGSLWQGSNNARNVLARTAERYGDGFAAEVRVANRPRVSGEQAGLLLYWDDDNYVKLVKESLDGVVYVLLAREEEGQTAVIAKTPIAATEARLKLAVRGSDVVASFREEDGGQAAPWRELGACAAIARGSGANVVLVAHGGAEAEPDWARFADFAMTV